MAVHATEGDSMFPRSRPLTGRSRIWGTGHYVPSHVVTNEDLERALETTDEWIVERTGIRFRRRASDDEATSDLAAVASASALEAAGITAGDLDLIIVATLTADSPMPSCAVHVQRKLGAPM